MRGASIIVLSIAAAAVAAPRPVRAVRIAANVLHDPMNGNYLILDGDLTATDQSGKIVWKATMQGGQLGWAHGLVTVDHRGAKPTDVVVDFLNPYDGKAVTSCAVPIPAQADADQYTVHVFDEAGSAYLSWMRERGPRVIRGGANRAPDPREGEAVVRALGCGVVELDLAQPDLTKPVACVVKPSSFVAVHLHGCSPAEKWVETPLEPGINPAALHVDIVTKDRTKDRAREIITESFLLVRDNDGKELWRRSIAVDHRMMPPQYPGRAPAGRP